MKKLISLLLSVLMIFSLFSVCAFAADDEFIITVANDLHYNLPYSNLPQGKYSEVDYSHVPSQGQLYVESELLIDAFLKAAAENESDVVIIPGDLVNGYAKVHEEHQIMSAKLLEFEKTSGKQVYVVPGNHDYYSNGAKVKMTPEHFVAYYAEFGYNEAIAKDDKSASYVADLNDEYRIIAVDSCKPNDGVNGMDADRVEWIKAQAEKAQQDGKKVIAMMHHNVLEHFIFGSTLHEASVIDKSWGLGEIFTQYNVKCSFVGHTHEQDVASYTGSNGNTFYDIVTNSLNAYPCPYRVVTFGDEVKIRTRYIDSIDMTSLKGVISDNCYNLATTNFREYTKQCAYKGVLSVLEGYLNPASIKNLLKLDPQKDAELCSIIDELIPTAKEMVYMPFYKKDETEEGKSIEALAKKLGLELKDSEIKNFAELAVFFYEEHVVGDENYGLLSKEFSILTTAVTVIFNELLKDVTAEHYAMLLNFLCSYLNVQVPVAFIDYTSSGIARMQGIDIFVSAVLSGVMLQFTTDEAPKDINVTLPSYGETTENEPTELTTFEKIIEFFKTVFSYLWRFFGF